MVLPPRVRSSAPQPCGVSFSLRRTLLASMVAASAGCALDGLSSLRHLGSSRRLLESFWQLVGRAEVRSLGFEAPDKGFVSGRPAAVVLGVWDVARSAYQHPNPPVFVALVGMVLALMCFLSTSTSTPSASTASFTKKPADRCLAGNPCPFFHRHNLLAVRTQRIYFTPDTLHASRLTPPPSTSPCPRAPRPCPSLCPSTSPPLRSGVSHRGREPSP